MALLFSSAIPCALPPAQSVAVCWQASLSVHHGGPLLGRPYLCSLLRNEATGLTCIVTAHTCSPEAWNQRQIRHYLHSRQAPRSSGQGDAVQQGAPARTSMRMGWEP